MVWTGELVEGREFSIGGMERGPSRAPLSGMPAVENSRGGRIEVLKIGAKRRKRGPYLAYTGGLGIGWVASTGLG